MKERVGRSGGRPIDAFIEVEAATNGRDNSRKGASKNDSNEDNSNGTSRIGKIAAKQLERAREASHHVRAFGRQAGEFAQRLLEKSRSLESVVVAPLAPVLVAGSFLEVAASKLGGGDAQKNLLESVSQVTGW